MILGGRAFWATPGGAATDLVILASSLLALAGLLFVVYVVAVVASVAYGVIRGPLPGSAHTAEPGEGARPGVAGEGVEVRTGATAAPGPRRVSSTTDGGL